MTIVPTTPRRRTPIPEADPLTEIRSLIAWLVRDADHGEILGRMDQALDDLAVQLAELQAERDDQEDRVDELEGEVAGLEDRIAAAIAVLGDEEDDALQPALCDDCGRLTAQGTCAHPGNDSEWYMVHDQLWPHQRIARRRIRERWPRPVSLPKQHEILRPPQHEVLS